MAVCFDKTMVVVDGICGVDEALPLLELLQAHHAARIDLFACTNVHSASLQVLIAAADRIVRLPADDFLRCWLVPLFEQAQIAGAAEAGGPCATDPAARQMIHAG